MERMEQDDIIIYNTDDGKSSVVLVGADRMVWLNQLQMAELFATSKQSISYHITNILKEKELPKIAVVKNILTTASDGKQYMVEHYSLDADTKPKDGKRTTGQSRRFGRFMTRTGWRWC